MYYLRLRLNKRCHTVLKLIHWLVPGPPGNASQYKKLTNCRDSARQQSLCHSRSFKVTDFDTNRKPVCDFVLVNDSNLHPISHLFPVIAHYLSDYPLTNRCFSLTRSFSVISLNLAISLMLTKIKFCELHFLVDSMGLATTNLTQLALQTNACRVIK